MFIITSVVRGRCVWKYCIVSDVVVSNPANVECAGIKSGENLRRTYAQVAQDRNDSYAQHVVAEPPPVWPSPGHRSITKTLLDCTSEGISSENTESIKQMVVRIV